MNRSEATQLFIHCYTLSSGSTTMLPFKTRVGVSSGMIRPRSTEHEHSYSFIATHDAR
jgi:hypothetical protein